MPKGVSKSARAMYLEMIGAACSYLLDMDISRYTEAKMEVKIDTSFDMEGDHFRFGETFTDPEP